MSVALELSEELAAADREALRQELSAHDAPFLGPRDFRGLNVLAREAGGRIAGGLAGDTVWGVLRIELLWVAADLRGAGLGARLLNAAEAEARARGCRTAWVETFDFQARPFYERHGYQVFGALDGHPNGHKTLFLSKTL